MQPTQAGNADGGWGAPYPAAGWGYAPQSGAPSAGPYSRPMGPPSGPVAPYGLGGQGTAPQSWNAPPPWGEPPVYARRNRGLGTIRLIASVLAAVVVIALAGIAGAYLVNHKGSFGVNSPSGTPAPSVVFSDSLFSPDGNWSHGVHCRFGTGGYLVTDNYFCLEQVTGLGDVNVKVSVKQLSGPTDSGYGLVLRTRDEQNYYLFHIFSNGYWDFDRPAGNQYQHILGPTANSAIKRGLNVTNTLEADMISSHFTFYVNGIKVGETNDPTYDSGQSGFDSEDGVTVMYNNFVITQP